MKKLESMAGFYYIGTRDDNIAKLVNIYQRGYACENLERAIVELTVLGASPPHMICCESDFGRRQIGRFADVLRGHPMLSRIPFIIDAAAMPTADQNYYVRNKLADDILFIKECDEKNLDAKIRFLHKFKTKAIELDEQTRPAVASFAPASINSLLKRCFDVLIAAAALVILSPLFLLIAMAVWMESRGPAIYVSKRAGRGYRIFNFYKFRTMFDGADLRIGEFEHLNQYHDSKETRFIKINNDPRITRVGRFLRNTSLDELPQLINVLSGDMSLVGNRPLPLYEAATLTTDDLAKRFLAPAGITGLWQIKKRGKEEMSVEERISLDIDYANNSNFLYDLWIMANTPKALIQKANT